MRWRPQYINDLSDAQNASVQRDGFRSDIIADCVVRAVAVAFDISYDEAFRILDAEPDGSVYDFHQKLADEVINGWRLRLVEKWKRPDDWQRVFPFPKGRFICTERGSRHVVAYIDNVRYDTVCSQSPISKIWALEAVELRVRLLPEKRRHFKTKEEEK